MSTERCLGVLLSVGILAAAMAVPASGQTPSRDELAKVDLRQAWHVSFPLKMTARIDAYHLVGGLVLAVASDGQVHAIRADTGEHIWTRQLSLRGFSTVWPPSETQINGQRALIFTRPAEVVFIDPQSGWQLKEVEPVQLRMPAVAGVAVSEEDYFVPETGGRFCAYKKGLVWPRWEMPTAGLIQVAPVFVAEDKMLIIADESGQLAAVDAETGKPLFKVDLDGAAVGELVVKGDVVYVASRNGRLNAISLRSGAVTWQYILRHRPASGPVVTATSCYQRLSGGGLQRVGLKQEWPNWHVSEANAFLAEWPGRVGLLLADGQLAVARVETGEIRSTVEIGEDYQAISNPYNDAMLIATEAGDVRCYRPRNSKPLTPADFGVVPVKTELVEAPESTNEENDDAMVGHSAAEPASKDEGF